MSRYVGATKILDAHHPEVEPEAGALGFARMFVRGIDEHQRTAEFVISSGEVDRYSEIVDPRAFDRETVKAFMANPVMLAGHRHSGQSGEPTVIGSWLGIKREGDVVAGVCRFASTPLAETYWDLVRGGHLRACSIGFIVRVWEMREVGEGENKRSVRVFTKIELIEVSLVAVPANRLALLKAAGFDHLAEVLPSPSPAPGGAQRHHRGDDADHVAALMRGMGELLDTNFNRLEEAMKADLSDPDGPVARLIEELHERAADHEGIDGYFRDAAPPKRRASGGSPPSLDALKQELRSLV